CRGCRTARPAEGAHARGACAWNPRIHGPLRAARGRAGAAAQASPRVGCAGERRAHERRRMRMRMMTTIAAALLAAVLTAPAAAQAEAELRVGVRRGEPKAELRLGVRVPVLRPRTHIHTDHCRRWIPPRCETVTERRYVPPRRERVWVQPVYERSKHTGRLVCVRPGHWRTIEHPGRWETVTREVHVPGRWEIVCGH